LPGGLGSTTGGVDAGMSQRWDVLRRDGRTVTSQGGDGPSEFEAFVAALPAQHEIALMADNVSTAYYRARRSGWEHDQLVGDAQSSLYRGGVGLVVTRLNSLADNPPIKRPTGTAGPRPKRAQHAPLPECEACGQPYPRTYPRREGQPCTACGTELVLIVHQTRWS
jgi:hypothetical protein